MSDSARRDVLQSLRIARALVDGASPDWAAQRFGVDTDRVERAWSFTRARLKEHFRSNGAEFTSIDDYLAAHPGRVLSVLLHWSEMLDQPELAASSRIGGNPADRRQKKDTGQGETGD